MDEVWKRAEIESPCIKLCVIDERHGHCLGCFRKRAEIAGWSRMSQDARREIIQELPKRASDLAPKRSRRRARPSE